MRRLFSPPINNYQNQCPYCPSEFETKGRLSSHLKQSHWKQGFQCQVCNVYACCQRSQALKHKHEKSPPKWKCPSDYKLFKCLICTREFLGQSIVMVKNHVSNIHKEKFDRNLSKTILMLCVRCQQRFEDTDSLEAHGKVCSYSLNV